MTLAVYPGSFNPWHEGHEDVLEKALKIFDHVVVAVGINPQKDPSEIINTTDKYFHEKYGEKVICLRYTGMLVDFIKTLNETRHIYGFEKRVSAVVRGLRNGGDLEQERAQQYWNEDLGLEVPVAFFITDRKLVHISSSAIRQINQMQRR